MPEGAVNATQRQRGAVCKGRHVWPDRGIEARHGGQQDSGIVVLGLGKDLRDWASFHQSATMHHRHAVGHLGYDTHVVGDQQKAGAGLVDQRAHQIKDLRLHGHVERGRWLIRDQQFRFKRQSHRDHHPLAHAARKLMRILLQARCGPVDADLVQHFDGKRAGGGNAHAFVDR